MKWLFPKYRWSFAVDAQDKVAYLTFDDGPIPEITEYVLKELKRYNAKATFFCIGQNIAKHPNIFSEIISQGHQIGNHTYDHLEAWRTGTETYISNVLLCQEEIQKNWNSTKTSAPKLFRPPYGQISKSKCTQLIALGYEIILWDVLSKDWVTNRKESYYVNNVIKNTLPGSIIVFHDSLKAERNLKTTLPRVLQELGKQGYRFDPIPVKSTLS
ncbi:polysaccharide deacetylase family protein [Aquimarina brevivitae]|uniref:polysaccharide deacetylase family protein n=1 Tax=Aquimarina brevivitae TaxID=323412 RepID=UPI0030FE58DF